MTRQAAEETVHYVAEVKRGLGKRSLRVLASLALDGECSFALLGRTDEIPDGAVVVEDGPALAPRWPKHTVMARGVTRARQEQVLTSPIWTSFVERSRGERVTYTDQRIERDATMQVTASVAEHRQAIARDGIDYPTRPPVLAAAVLNIALAATAERPQIPSVF